MGLLTQLFLVMVCMIIAAAAPFAGVLLTMGCLAIGGLALIKVLDALVIIIYDFGSIRASFMRRTRNPRRFIASIWHTIKRIWRIACHVRRVVQQTIRFVMGPLDRRLDRFPWTQWFARFVGRWSLRLAMLATPLAIYTLWYVYEPYGEKPDPRVVIEFQPMTIGHVYDRNDLIVMRAYHEARVQLSAKEFAHPRYDVIRQALISAEDKRFMTHNGVDWLATSLELIKTLGKKLRGQDGRGASSISQQYDRNIYPKIKAIVARQDSGSLTVNNVVTRWMASIVGIEWTNKCMRKFPEIRFAVWMEHGLAQELGSKQAAKDMILAGYANFVNLGDGVYGVEYRARHSFCKGADELEPHEAAYIASLIPLPNIYSKAQSGVDIEGAISRRNHVLKRMAQNDYITWEQFADYRQRPLGFCAVPEGPKTEAPAAVKVARKDLRGVKVKDAGMERNLTPEDLDSGNIELKLTISLPIQRILNRAAKRAIYNDPPSTPPGFTGKYPGVPAPQMAAVVMRPDGEILGLFGGFIDENIRYGYIDNNFAHEAIVPAGSTYKGTVGAAAIVDAGIDPDDIVFDERVCIRMNTAGKMHCFDNYKEEYNGAVPLRKASAESLNGAFMSTILRRAGGVPAVIAWSRELGITSRLDPYPPTILGSNGVRPIEMAKVFSRLASGLKSEPFIVSRITDRAGNELYTRVGSVQRLKIPGTNEPFPPEKLNKIQQLLRGNVRLPGGTARKLLGTEKFPVAVMCKTGTANEHRAAWLGCSTYGPEGVTVVAWAGYENFTPLPYVDLPIELRATGGSMLGDFMRQTFNEMYGHDNPLGLPPDMPEEIEAPISQYTCLNYPELCSDK